MKTKDKIKYIKQFRPVKIVINIDDIVSKNQQNLSHNILIKHIEDCIKSIISNNDKINKIITNGNLASVIDFFDKNDNTTITTGAMVFGKPIFEPYILAKILNVDFYVDPRMKWDDNNIYFCYNDYNIVTINVIDTNMYLI